MKTTNEVLTETGLTYPMLNRLKDLGIIPKPKLRGQGRRKGVVGVYEDDIIDIIKNVKHQQESGLSLTQIARKAIQPKESPKKAEQQGKIVAPGNPRLMSEYVNATQGLFEQVARENPGHELHAIRLVAVKGKYKKYLVPIEIEVVPRDSGTAVLYRD